MPRAKKTESKKSTSNSSKKETKPKTKSKVKISAKKPAKKTTRSKTPKTKTKTKSKAKPIIVDVINDDELENDTFFSDESLVVNDKELSEAKKFFLNLEEGEVPREEARDEIIEEEKIIESEEVEAPKSENDKQKQFFSELVTEMRERKGEVRKGAKSKNTVYKNKKSIRLYRNLAWKFLGLVGILAVVVFYFSFSKLTILITPEVEAMNESLSLKIANQQQGEVRSGDGRDQVSGEVNELKVEIERTYQATGEEYVGEEIVGKVRIINNYSRSQALVATTRLLSPDNKQYRIKESVNVPAGGEVEVEIYADEISRDMAIAPTRFTIPGLWVGLQDSIYAQSDAPFKYNQKIETYVKASDIQLAKSESYDLVIEEAKTIKPLSQGDKILYKILEPVDVEVDAEAGDRVEDFSLKINATVVVISFSKDEVEKLAGRKLIVLVPDDKEFSAFNPASLSYVLESYDEEEKVAIIKATFSGHMVLKNDANLINKENLVNLKAEQIKTYLKEYPEINNYELEFYPPFVERAPHLIDRIEIKIKK